jgi:hypothetical protein
VIYPWRSLWLALATSHRLALRECKASLKQPIMALSHCIANHSQTPNENGSNLAKPVECAITKMITLQAPKLFKTIWLIDKYSQEAHTNEQRAEDRIFKWS